MQEFQKELGQWRRDPAGKKKPKYSYRTVDELKAKGKLARRSAQPSAGELAQVKVGSNHRGSDSDSTYLLFYSVLVYCVRQSCFTICTHFICLHQHTSANSFCT